MTVKYSNEIEASLRAISLTLAEPETGVPSDPTREELADYIGDMLQELRDLARGGGMATVGALLELAEQEAKRGAASKGKAASK